MSQVEIRNVKSARERRAFIHFPWKIYRPHGRNSVQYPQWVPPLLVDEKLTFDKHRNKWFMQGEEEDWLAYRDGKLIGRIAAHIDHGYINFQKDQAGFIGFFECFDDSEAAQALFATAETWLKNKGMKGVVGPINQSTNRVLGCQVAGFATPPVVYMSWNPPYFANLFLENGYQKVKNLYSYRMSTSLKLSEKIIRVAELCRSRENVTIRKLDMKTEFDRLVETIRDIYNDAWNNRWGFVPWTREQFEQLAHDLKLILNPEMVLIAEIAGKAVGFALPIPDVNRVLIRMNGRLFPTGIFKLLTGIRRIKVLRVAAFAVRQTCRNRGIDALFVYELYQRGLKNGFSGAEFSWILEDNRDLRNMLENWGAENYKTHRIYRKEFS